MAANSKKFIIAVLIIFLAIVAIKFFLIKPLPPQQEAAAAGKYDEFAKCLSQKGIKLYGAEWATSQQRQKNAFGSSFQYVNYTECAVPGDAGQISDVCKEAKIQVMPTWEFPGGKRKEGDLKLEDLSKLSKCQLPSSATVQK